MKTITIDPITRIEGHLRIELEVEDGVVRAARSSGALYRGLEQVLVGRHPLDAPKIAQRICGVCPIAHATAASMALDHALGLDVPPTGQLLRNLIFGANFLHNHILHFYHLALLDYLDPRGFPSLGLAPVVGFLSPSGVEDRRFSGEENERLARNYVAALTMRRKAHELVATLGGKMPHEMAIVPGGVTCRPTLADLEAYRFRLKEVRAFVEGALWEDVLLLIRRYQDHFQVGRTECLLSFGVFPLEEGRRALPAGAVRGGRVERADAQAITEGMSSSWYSGEGGNPDRGKEGAYSWIKAPRYRGEPSEVGPAARMRVALEFGDEELASLITTGLREAAACPEELASVAGRHLSRALEARYIAGKLSEWVDLVDPAAPTAVPYAVPDEAVGLGLTDAPRGALLHSLRIHGGRIASYQVVSPTTWNGSPRDERGAPGPIEQALSGVKVRGDGLTEAGRIVRSFDPCLACAVQ